ncbi:hypothetical protein AAVH_17100 [Aphelenchoides avenae]|nr:hypothetical protein AAVH_17100 [Aphelenchus avenae]
MLPSVAILSVFLPAVLAVIVTPPQRFDDRSLTIYGVQLTDAGKFRCSTYYECDDITGRCEGGGNRSSGSYWSTSDSRLRTSYSSIVHDVTVSAPPRINGSNVDNHTVTADHGYWMRLRCIVVESESPVVVEWSINGTVVNDSPPHLSLDQGARPNRYYLTRNDMTSRDEGIYRCKVSNEQGSDEISYVVKVAPPEPYDPDWKPDYTDEAAIGHNGDRYPPVESMEDD